MMNELFEGINEQLTLCFHQWQIQEPESRIEPLPNTTRLVFQIEGFSKFNNWSKQQEETSQNVDKITGETCETVYVIFSVPKEHWTHRDQIVLENINSIDVLHRIVSGKAL